jgi:Cof subfamily protein (haloacid dehalogenase superfamily)
MAGIELIAVDLDGTLLTSHGRVDPEGALALRRAEAQGATVVVASARAMASASRLAAEIGVHCPVVASDGAQILERPGGPVLAEHSIPLDVGRALAEYTDENDWWISTAVGEKLYSRVPIPEAAEPITERIGVARNIDAVHAPLARILVFDRQAIHGLARRVESRHADVCRTQLYYDAAGMSKALAVLSRSADKGTAVAWLAGRLGVPRERVMAIGDNASDVYMLEYARVGVAVANANEHAKVGADVIGPSNDDHGVAWAVEHYVLGR